MKGSRLLSSFARVTAGRPIRIGHGKILNDLTRYFSFAQQLASKAAPAKGEDCSIPGIRAQALPASVSVAVASPLSAKRRRLLEPRSISEPRGFVGARNSEDWLKHFHPEQSYQCFKPKLRSLQGKWMRAMSMSD